MRQILRLEHADGSGIFTSYIDDVKRYYVQWDVPCHGDVDKRHQQFNSPFQEENSIFDFIQGVHFCAYKSIDQFQEWIKPNEFKQYHEHGIKAYLIEVSDCFVGVDQIMFKKDDIVSKKDVSQLFL